ncbi:MAG: DNA polymerase/3'-5' exonuclease PolX [Gemmatimonadales bacterium]|nr:DNA polymerase/3'-5' exonuclease PolX [Gemmatimonadales bacterium]MYG49765.1 DNA polymerase/3'-5' exonuclease PolX [Gemmatimonadales bacterium]MYK01539.1 DNA polymerase/3'-5' exonuclease PolX [Candidatus Palauibacter ramosifaciens]
MENIEIVRVLDEVADLLEIQQANPFRVRAYRNAVRTINAHASPLRKLVEQGADLAELPSIGKGLADNIRELVESGRLTMLEEMAAEIPPGLVELMRLPGVGPKKARKLWDELGVESIDDLEEVASEGRVAELPGFGVKTQDRILSGIRNYRTSTTRFRLGEVDKLLPPLIDHLQATPGVTRLEVAGSYRRRKETVGDIDILVLADDARAASDALTGFSGVESVIGAGGTKTSVRLRSGLQVDLRVVPPESWGAALIYFTGSKEHNIRLRRRALDRTLRVSEYGVFTIPEDSLDDALGERGIASEGEMVAGATEEEVYRALDLSWLPPEIRRDRGEFAASDAGELPRLVETSDLRGDVHMHSTWSDGRASLEEMVRACVARGYEYMAITDHSKALAMVEGLDAAKLRRQWQEIAEVQAAHPEIRILRGLEVDILRDGSLDLEDEMLDQLDVVIISVHSFFGMDRAQQTSRVLKALAHPRSMIFGHPTGRIINRRGPIDVDIDDILHACAEFGVAVEVNSHPHRLDLKDSHLWRARDLGVPVVVATDAHRPEDLDLAHYGIEQARRAWLTPEHVLNTRGVDDFLAALRRRPAI